MLMAVLRAAKSADEWLKHRAGRPYEAALTVGVVGETIHRLVELRDALTAHRDISADVALWLVVSMGLLLRQGGELHEAMLRRRTSVRRRRRGGNGG